MSDDNWRSPLFETDLSFSSPPPQAPSEEFDEEFEGVDLDRFSHAFQDMITPTGPFPTYHDSAPSLVSSAISTNTTDSLEVSATLEYFPVTYYTSNYPPPCDLALPDVDFDFKYNEVDPKHISVFSDPSLSLDSFGLSQVSPTSFSEVHVVNAQSDDGPYRPPVGISPQSLSTAFHSPPLAVPTDICAASMQQAPKSPNPDTGSTQPRKQPRKRRARRTGPINFICPHCDICKHHFCLSFYKLNLKILSST